MTSIALQLGVNTFSMGKRKAALAAADEIEKLMKSVGHADGKTGSACI
jgi:hypothetical protein